MSDLSKLQMAETSADGTFETGATVAAGPSSAQAVTLATPLTTARGTVLPTFHVDPLPSPRERYEPRDRLGEGGMGEVTLAFDHDIGRAVAIKVLRRDLTKDAPSVERFVGEIKTVGALEHPNIVPIHDVGIDSEGRYFFVMKRVEGDTLEQVIERLAAGDPATHAAYRFHRRIEVVIALLRALDYSHSQGVVHRDIKPANVMVGKYGEVILMDWGVAKPESLPEAPVSALAAARTLPVSARSRLFATRQGALVGTPAYMSPEQARGELSAIDARSDVYAACVLLHELMGLRHYLHDQTTLEGVLAAICSGNVKLFDGPTHPAQGNMPTEVHHIVKKGLQVDPAKRFQSAAELIDQLDRTLDGTFAAQCPVTLGKLTLRGLGRALDRYPGPTLLATAAFFIAVIGVTVVAVRSLL